MGIKIQVHAGSLILKAVPNSAVANSSPVKDAVVLHCSNGSNLPYDIEVASYLTTAANIAIFHFPGVAPVVKATVGGRNGKLGRLLGKAHRVRVPLGAWSPENPGTCELIVRAEVTRSLIPITYNVPEEVTVT